jgi:hypothetical protein
MKGDIPHKVGVRSGAHPFLPNPFHRVAHDYLMKVKHHGLKISPFINQISGVESATAIDCERYTSMSFGWHHG